jgi:hypothetical protein
MAVYITDFLNPEVGAASNLKLRIVKPYTIIWHNLAGLNPCLQYAFTLGTLIA